jgi:hypothetical protein
MKAAAIWFAQESSPPVPDEATRLRLLTGAMGSQDLKLAYANWLTATGASASWDKLGTVLSLDAGPLARFAGSGDAQHPDLPRYEGAHGLPGPARLGGHRIFQIPLRRLLT